MKIKNLNVFEKHVEKGVLALGLLFSLWVVWSYILAGDVTVDVKGQTKAPAEVEQMIKRTADAARGKVLSNEMPRELAEVQAPDYISAFKKRLVTIGRDFGETKYEFILGNHGLDPKDVEVKQPDAVPYIDPVPPQVARLRVSQAHGVLAEPSDPQLLLSLEKLIGPDVPRDFRSVTIRAEFPLDAWRNELRRSQPGRQVIQEEKWRGKLGVVDVVLQRQSRASAADRWSRTEDIGRLPHVKTVVDRTRQEWLPREAVIAVRTVMASQPQITLPPYVPTEAGDWLPPGVDPRRMQPERAERVRQALALVNDLQRQIFESTGGGGGGEAAPAPAPVEPAVPEAGLPPAAAGAAEGGAGGGLPPGAGGAFVPGAGAPDGPAPAAGGEGRVQNLLVLERKLETAYADLLSAMGVGKNAPRAAADDDAADVAPAGDAIDLWAHDISVRPGYQYRYRVQAYVINPLFQSDKLVEQQHKAFYHRIALATDWSDWSEPITIEPEFEFYLVEGMTGNNSPATVEVYTIFAGRWMRQRFRVQPGDPIGGTVNINVNGVPRPVDMRLNWVVVDLESISAGEGGNAKTTSMIVLDRSSGELVNRTQARDVNDQQRLRRQFQAEAAERQASTGGPVADDRTAFRSTR